MTFRTRGAVLVQATLMLFTFFGMAALVVDLGLASLEQQRMQDAADSAAIEGLRLRDIGDPALTHDIRAGVAKRSMGPFDDAQQDMDAIVAVGQGSWNANANIALTGRWTPDLQQNESNEKFGDFVAGKYIPEPLNGEDPENWHDETFDYSRQDFDHEGGDHELLARLRRTNNLDGLDGVDSVSSHGPTLPFLFGRGSLIAAGGGSSYDPRRDGVTVRSTAIASVRQAVSVSRLDPSTPLVGVVPFSVRAITLESWSANDAPIELSTGPLVPLVLHSPVRLGDPSKFGAIPTTDPLNSQPSVVVAIVGGDSSGGAGSLHVVGFGIISSTLTKQPGKVIANASAIDPGAAGKQSALSEGESVLAPVLVR